MIARRYVIRPKADHDLEEQALYFAQEGGIELGHRFLDAAERTLALLATQPHMGWRSRTLSVKFGDLRIFRVGGFERILVIYRPREDGVEILRVVHGSRNIRTFLRKEGIE